LRYREAARTVCAMFTRLATTLAAWIVAFSVVSSLLQLFGDQLAAMSPMLRALVISGILVVLMVNVVMPVLGPRIARLAVRPRAPQASRAVRDSLAALESPEPAAPTRA
jgi:antibiotic biosynthesis monooxygenase (ABM) superfamily enzyme